MTKESLLLKTLVFIVVESVLVYLLFYLDSINIAYIMLDYVIVWLIIIVAMLYIESIRGEKHECIRKNI